MVSLHNTWKLKLKQCHPKLPVDSLSTYFSNNKDKSNVIAFFRAKVFSKVFIEVTSKKKAWYIGSLITLRHALKHILSMRIL